jgi:uncharacterized protein YjbI with pentapeptide repeats
MGPGGTLRMVFEADAWDSTISFAPRIPVALGGTLELTFADDVNPAAQLGRIFDLFDWTGVAPIGAFAISSPYAWNLSNLYTTGEVTLNAIPEPISVALVFIAAAGLFVARPTRSLCAGLLTPHRSSTAGLLVSLSPLLLVSPSPARADIFQWEYVDPADPTQGKRQSTTLTPGGAGVDVVHGAALAGRDLTKAYLIGADIKNAFGSRTILTNADLSNSNLSNAFFSGATLTDANFTDAVVRGAIFDRVASGAPPGDNAGPVPYTRWPAERPDENSLKGSGITLEQLYSTASFQANDLSNVNLAFNLLEGAHFAGKDFTNASFYFATLSDVDFRRANLSNTNLNYAVLTRADLRDANLANASFSWATLTNTNFADQTLANADFSYTDVTSADFSHANLFNADFSGASLTDAILIAADARGASFGIVQPCRYICGPIGTGLARAATTNLIFPNGQVNGLDLDADSQLVVRDYDDDSNVGNPLPPIPITVDQHLTMGPGGTLRMVFEADAWDSTISFAPGIPVTLGGTLELTFADDVNPATQLGRTFDLFDWTGVHPTGAFALSSPYSWDLSGLYTTGEVTLTAVPEPATFMLCLLGILSLRVGVRRQRPNTRTGGTRERKEICPQMVADKHRYRVDQTPNICSNRRRSVDQCRSMSDEESHAEAQRRGGVAVERFSLRPQRLCVSLFLTVVFSLPARADIFQWEYVNPADTSQSKRQSTTLTPGGAGVDAVPGADLFGRNLTMAYLIGADLTGIYARNANLTDADLRQANLTNTYFGGATLTGAELTDANIRGANFDIVYGVVDGWLDVSFGFLGTGIIPTQLYSTASYQAHDLSGVGLAGSQLDGAKFAGQNLTNANFAGARLTNADFTGAEVSGASFGILCGQIPFCVPSGISLFQLYSTVSYQAGDLSGIGFFGSNNLAGGNFAGQNLTNANFIGATLTDTDFTAADTRRASGLDISDLLGATTTNLIRPDGYISGLDLNSTDRLVVRDYDGDFRPGLALPPIAIMVDQHLDIAPGGTLRMVFEANAWDSTISFAPGIPVTLGGTLELTFAADVNLASQVGRTFDLFDWTGVNPTGAFSIASPYVWNLSSLYTTGEVTLTAVPEPSAIVLLSFGVMGGLAMQRRQHAKFHQHATRAASARPHELAKFAADYRHYSDECGLSRASRALACKMPRSVPTRRKPSISSLSESVSKPWLLRSISSRIRSWSSSAKASETMASAFSGERTSRSMIADSWTALADILLCYRAGEMKTKSTNVRPRGSWFSERAAYLETRRSPECSEKRQSTACLQSPAVEFNCVTENR